MIQTNQLREVVRDRGVLGALRMFFLPSPMIPVPKPEEIADARDEAALSIVARQGEGSVLLSVRQIDMRRVDMDEGRAQEGVDD